jgi:hypothetical protein
MKKKNRDQKKLQLVKEKVATLTVDQIELVKGGDGVNKTIATPTTTVIQSGIDCGGR